MNLRTDLINKRKKLTTTALQRIAHDVATKLSQHPRYQNSQNIGSYVSTAGEVPTSLLQPTPKQPFYFPVITDAQACTLVFKSWEKETLMTPNLYGIPEPITGTLIAPEKLNLLLIPLVAFDTEKYRLGMGKGYYDRYLQQTPNTVYRLGLAYDFQQIDALPHPAWEQPLDDILIFQTYPEDFLNV